MFLRTAFLAGLSLIPAPAIAQCGGDFSSFINGLKSEAVANGHAPKTVDAFFAPIRLDQKVIKADRAQGFFKKTFIEFSQAVISKNRLDHGRNNARKYADVFDRIERDFGIQRGVLLAFWALETDYGAVQGDFNTANALVTLAHDCRRPHLFRPQVLAAIELFERGDFDPASTTGAWAGEIGQVQMLPEDILRNGVDGDGDGHVRLKTSAADALMSGAKMIKGFGWRANEPWLQEVTVPEDLDWRLTGLDHELPVDEWARRGVKAHSGELARNLKGSILLPVGRKGPAFIAYPNFHVYLKWNQSFVYVNTAAYFATRLDGAPVFDAGNPEPGLGDKEMKALQQRLAARGHDVGKIDGILGEKTREAVQKEQERLGLPADAWPTRALLDRL
ncbi:lytic murein transglycosylase [Defluviimonas sp. WL0002]|uniref:Lytic murein transglycosylase n=1 Tax=Albidovulum marisflavi TaxID=2984159 RepID=A0ABT2Z9S0_9RHOB|nr:lytic murein transglycosylase [Defluviimonas sp. WL0002]MCV2867894.1 lytic murein transglycosylase [Defluviimonas sp. WL0002]